MKPEKPVNHEIDRNFLFEVLPYHNYHYDAGVGGLSRYRVDPEKLIKYIKQKL